MSNTPPSDSPQKGEKPEEKNIVKEQLAEDAKELKPLVENLSQVLLIDIRMTDYLLARGFLDRLVSRIERMTRYAGAAKEREELDALMFKGQFTIYGKEVKHRIHWVELYDAYLKSMRMAGNAKIKVILIDGKKKRFRATEIRMIMLDVIRKIEEISAKVLIKASQTPSPQGGSPFAGMTNLGFKETGFSDVDVDLDFATPPNKPQSDVDEDEEGEEVSELDLAKHSQSL
jgi:hypothetical protein